MTPLPCILCACNIKSNVPNSCNRKENVETSNINEELYKKSSTISTEIPSSNGIYNEPMILPSRVKSMVSYRSEDMRKQGKREVEEDVKELIESAG